MDKLRRFKSFHYVLLVGVVQQENCFPYSFITNVGATVNITPYALHRILNVDHMCRRHYAEFHFAIDRHIRLPGKHLGGHIVSSLAV